jgi:fumarate hydratase class II
MPTTRIETDSMGQMTVPSDALYGATTQRAVENFPVSGRPVPVEVIRAFALLKKACAETNRELRKLDAKRAGAIVKACDRILEELADAPRGAAAAGPRRGSKAVARDAGGDASRDGAAGARGGSRAAAFMRHFPIDVFQTGSGTSTNMNVNEVIANLAALDAGKSIGARDPLHPNDHVNMGQSSNDTFPTAMARQWDKIVKIGRTHLMDATPIRLGQEFGGFAAQAEYCVVRAERAMMRLAENLPIGGTAVGTGINTHPDFGDRVARRLAKATGIAFAEAKNHFEAQATRDCIVEASGELKTIAVALSKIANDIRWLGSGPRAGLFELSLPATQPGSSIMPGKVNPVICESVMMVACQVVGHDAAITLGGFGGTGSLFQLNVAMPMMAENLQGAIALLANASEMFVDKCVEGLEANVEIATGMVEKSLMLCTSLAPVIGYDNAAKAAKEAFKSGATIREHVLKHNLVHPKKLDELLDPWSMTEPGGEGSGGG